MGSLRHAMTAVAVVVPLLAAWPSDSLAQVSPYVADSMTAVLYHFDEADSEVVKDAGGHRVDGQPQRVSWQAEGRFGGGLRLGCASRVTLQSVSAGLDAPNLTYEAWVRLTDVGYNPIITSVTVGNDPLGAGRMLCVDYLGHLFAAANRTYQARGRTVLPVGQWVHVAGVFDEDRGVVQVYLNGVLDGQGPLGVGARGKTEVWLGSDVIFHGLCGEMDEVRISSTSREFGSVSVIATTWGTIKAASGIRPLKPRRAPSRHRVPARPGPLRRLSVAGPRKGG